MGEAVSGGGLLMPTRLHLAAAVLEQQHIVLRAIAHLPDKPPVLKVIMEQYEQGMGELLEKNKGVSR